MACRCQPCGQILEVTIITLSTKKKTGLSRTKGKGIWSRESVRERVREIIEEKEAKGLAEATSRKEIS